MSVEKKKRIFYLDFVRAIAVIIILLTHYNALYVYMWDETALKKVVITWRIANLYIGDFGVSLFLIVSGAALMYVYDSNLRLKNFYKKRFISIYPMFWLAWFAAFMHSFYVSRGIDLSVPKQNIIFTLTGMDGYMQGAVPTFYKVGDWFIGFIIIVYIIFPLLRIGVKKYPLILTVAVVLTYATCFYWNPWPLSASTYIFMRLPEIVFGMLFVKYLKKVPNWMALASLLVIILNSVIKPQFSSNLQTTYIGIAAFLVLAYVGEWLERIKKVKLFGETLSRYSYAIFLTHHYIIYYIASKFDLTKISILESYLLFILCCIVITLISKILFEADRHIKDYMKKDW